MPELVRLYITQIVVGFVVSAVFVAVLLWANVANLGHLVTSSDAGLLAVFLLWLFNGIVFAGVQFAIAVMNMADDTKGPRGGRRAPIVRGEPALVLVVAETRRSNVPVRRR